MYMQNAASSTKKNKKQAVEMRLLLLGACWYALVFDNSISLA